MKCTSLLAKFPSQKKKEGYQKKKRMKPKRFVTSRRQKGRKRGTPIDVSRKKCRGKKEKDSYFPCLCSEKSRGLPQKEI